MPQNDIVVDANVMALYGTSAAGKHRDLFAWLRCCGGLCVSKAILKEYCRQGSPLVASLLDSLLKEKRCSSIANSTLKAFIADTGYNYTCNVQDINVARTVFRSFRKSLVSLDNKLRVDVNNFPAVNGVQPKAFSVAPAALLTAAIGGVCSQGTH